MKTKILSKQKMITNISGLGKGDRAHLGPYYGIVQCTRAASETKSGRRMFKVYGSTLLVNRGNYTFKALREAIGN